LRAGSTLRPKSVSAYSVLSGGFSPNTRRDSNKATGLGLDYPTAGYATVNLYGSLQTRDRFAITLGVNNLFNRRYFAYNEQPHTAAINPSPIAAPERSVWLGFNYNF